MFIVPVSRQAAPLPRAFDRLFDDAFERFLGATVNPQPATAAPRVPALDLAETDDAWIATLDLPGVARADLKVQIDGRRVQIAAELPVAADMPSGAAVADANPPASPPARLVHRERQPAGYARTLTLPREIDPAASSAKLLDGVLTLTLAKRRAADAGSLQIS